MFTRVYRSCAPGGGGGGLWSHRSSTLLSCLQICRLLLKPQVSPVSMDIVDWVVVESPGPDIPPVVDLDMSPVMTQFASLSPEESQVSHLSSVDLYNCRPIGCAWISMWMLSTCSLCLRRLRDPAGTDSFSPCFVTGGAFVVGITGCRLSA